MNNDQVKLNTANKAIKSGIWYTVSNFTMKGIGFLTTPVFTRLMTKEEYGDFNNYQIWTLLFLYVTSLNLEASIGRASKDFEEEQDSYVLSMVSLYMGFTVICWGVCNLLYSPFSSVLSMNQTYMNSMFLYLLFFPAVQLFQSIERFRYRYKWNVATGMFVSIGTSVLSVLLVLLMKDKVLGRVIGFILPAVLLGGVLIIYMAKKGRRIRVSYWKYALPIVLPYIPHLLSMYLLSNLDRIMIRDYCGSEKMALYTLAYTCGMMITLLFNSANEAYGPWLTDKLHQKDYGAIRKYSLFYVCIISALAFGMTLFSPEILLVMGGEGYMEAIYVMPPVAAGCFLQFVYTLYVNVEQYEKRTIGMAVASAVAVVFNYVLNYVFIRQYGYIAAAYTTFACYFILLVFHMILVRWIGMSIVYQNTKIIVLAAMFSILTFSVSFLLEQTVLRWICIGIYMIVLLILFAKYRRRLMGLLKMKGA